MVVCTSDAEYDELYDWLNSIEFSRQKKNLSRDFSDAVLVAEILKRYYPRLVEKHNYNSANSHLAKLENWLTLDRKVLAHLGLRETRDMYSELAAASRGKIESFLLKIKRKIDSDREERNRLLAQDDACEENAPNYDEFVHLLENIKIKEDEIQSLNQRVAHLESLLHLKEQRIQDLNYQLSTCKCNGYQ